MCGGRRPAATEGANDAAGCAGRRRAAVCIIRRRRRGRGRGRLEVLLKGDKGGVGDQSHAGEQGQQPHPNGSHQRGTLPVR